MPSADRKSSWRLDRDVTNRVSTERTADRQPTADDSSPVRDIGPEQAASEASRQIHAAVAPSDSRRKAVDTHSHGAHAPVGRQRHGALAGSRRVMLALALAAAAAVAIAVLGIVS